METSPLPLEPTQAAGIAGMKAGLQRLRATYIAVPEDKLDWSPSETAKSANEILAHCIGSNRAIARVLAGEMTSAGPEDYPPVSSPKQAVADLESSSDAILRALEAMTPELFVTSPETPFGPLPMSEWMTFCGPHLGEHAGQIDYLQTIWGDLENHW